MKHRVAVLSAALAVLASVATQAPSALADDEPITPGVPLVCPDPVSGCDRTYIDPFDPLSQYWGAEGEEPLPQPLLFGENTDTFSRDTSRGTFTTINWNSVKDVNGNAFLHDGVVGVEVTLPTVNWHYKPCDARPGQTPDPYNGACLNPGRANSYYFAKNYFADGTNNFGAGLFVGNYSNRSMCAPPCTHYWGQRVGRIDVETSTKAATTGSTDANFVRNRFAQFASSFATHANGGTYGLSVGTIKVLQIGDASVVRLSGYFSRGGQQVGSGDASVHLFEEGAGASSSGGQGLGAFATVGTNPNGFYTSGAMYSGKYTMYVIDNITHTCKRKLHVNLLATGRLDFDLDSADFGQGVTGPCPA